MNEVRTGYPYELGAEAPFAMPPPVIPPCPLCSGQVDPDDPAAQALDWGVRVAESTPGVSDFWKTMAAADLYRQREVGNQETAVLLDEFVGSTQKVLVIGEGWGTAQEIGGYNGRATEEEEEEVERPEPPTPRGKPSPKTKPYDGPPVQPPEGWASKACCLEEFKYPDDLNPYFERGPGKTYVGLRFTVLAEFKQGGLATTYLMKAGTGKGEGPSGETQGESSLTCDCKCCRFQQFIRVRHLGEYAPGLLPGVGVSTPGTDFYEDCFFWSEKKSRQKELGSGPTWHRQRFGEWPPKPGPDDHVDCPGLAPEDYPEAGPFKQCRSQSGSAPGGRYDWGSSGMSSGSCFYVNVDHPGALLTWGSRFAIKVDLRGEIRDACRNWALAGPPKTLTYDAEGKVNELGFVDYKKDPSARGDAGGIEVGKEKRRVYRGEGRDCSRPKKARPK